MSANETRQSDEQGTLTEDEASKQTTQPHPIADLVARLTRPERERRVRGLMDESRLILDRAIDQHVLADRRTVCATVTLFSGGNDSTVLAHLFRDTATHAGHANTTIGIEQTREFVRNVCEEWGLPLLERTSKSESDSYRALVLAHGFPGPGHHFKMFQRLKERAIEQMQRELVGNPYRERVVFLAGRRRSESQRRTNVVEAERNRSKVWVSPLVNWTALDLNTYRLMHGDVPRNQVSDLIHMSGECLCGAFASPGERAEISMWFPEIFEVIAGLEAEIADRDDIPEHRKIWGWGADPEVLKRTRDKARIRSAKVGALCSSCDDRFQPSLFETGGLA